MFLWLGPTDMAAIFVIALLLFGPDQLPKVARQLGDVMRHMQNTTQSFMLEMDRAAREADFRPAVGPDDVANAESNDETEVAAQPETTLESKPETTPETKPDSKQSPVVPEPEPPADEVK